MFVRNRDEIYNFYVLDFEEVRFLEEKYIIIIWINLFEFIKVLLFVKDMKLGEDVRFEVQVSVYFFFKYNWYFSGKEIVLFDRREIDQDKDIFILVIK